VVGGDLREETLCGNKLGTIEVGSGGLVRAILGEPCWLRNRSWYCAATTAIGENGVLTVDPFGELGFFCCVIVGSGCECAGRVGEGVGQAVVVVLVLLAGNGLDGVDSEVVRSRRNSHSLLLPAFDGVGQSGLRRVLYVAGG
jgi:hypothetical protein